MRLMKGRGGRAGAPAAFLDRDGTINRNRHGVYITRPGQLELYANSAEALRLLAAKGYRLVLISNQSGIGRGYMTLAEAKKINLRLEELLESEGIELDGVYICPHTPEARCRCRKPATGLLEEAAADMKVDLDRSFMAGDKASDIELARRAGIKGWLVLTGGGRAAAIKSGIKAFRDLLSLAKHIPDANKEEK